MKKETQIEKLASFIMNEVDGEPSQNEGAGDCAIRIMKRYKEQVNNIQYQLDELEGACNDWMPSKDTSVTRCSNCGKDRWKHTYN